MKEQGLGHKGEIDSVAYSHASGLAYELKVETRVMIVIKIGVGSLSR